MAEPSRTAGTTGQELIEYALILPLLLLLFFGILELGRVIFTYNTISNAAREGARAGVIRLADETDVKSATLRLTTGLDLTADDIDVTLTETTVQVRVPYSVTLIAGPVIDALAGDADIALTAVSTMRRE